MSEIQIRWASQHDWFIRAEGDKVIVEDIDSEGSNGELVFSSFEALYIWAGY